MPVDELADEKMHRALRMTRLFLRRPARAGHPLLWACEGCGERLPAGMGACRCCIGCDGGGWLDAVVRHPTRPAAALRKVLIPCYRCAGRGLDPRHGSST